MNKFCYRPEIDGLRAIAVLAVVLFHAGLGVSGGFIGVDVFFVISGFLITSLIIKDLEAGKFTFINFWERRARRIIPASVALVLAVLSAGYFLLLPSDYTNLGKSGLMQAIFGANLYFWRTTNYFAQAAEEQPLLHTWSLAVEEQFYLFVPLLLVLIFRSETFRQRGLLLMLFCFALLISLALSIVAVSQMPGFAFYLLPTRAWEMLCGSVVAVLPVVHLSRLWREVLSGIGLTAILVPCFLYTKQTSFPGLAALPPCLGTALFIWASYPLAGTIPSTAAQLLSTRPCVFLGLISYSLYLWHWPLFAFSTYWTLEPLSLPVRIGLTFAGLLMGILSWRFIETPFRLRRWGTSRRSIFVWAGGGLAFTAVIAVLMILRDGFPQRFSTAVLKFDTAKAEAFQKNQITQPVGLEDARANRFPRLGAPAPAPVSVMVWGDSHARSILPAADQLGRESNIGVLTAWYTSTPPVIDFAPSPHSKSFSLGAESIEFNSSILRFISSHKVPHVLLAARWSYYFQEENDPNLKNEAGRLGRLLVETVRQIREAGCHPWILMEVPGHLVSVPKALVLREVLNTDIARFCATPTTVESQNCRMTALIPALVAAGANIIDVSAWLIDPALGNYQMVHEGLLLYYDEHHLTQHGARHVRQALMPLFESKISNGTKPSTKTKG
jgi:peptidoglycan/LPS O-acetylase OafA/YrhL